MTIKEVIDYVDSINPNDMTREEKINILSDLDLSLYNDVISNYKDAPSFNGYNPEEIDEDTKLLVKAPYSDMYKFYLNAQVYLLHQEINYYNNNMEIFNDLYSKFIAFYNRTNKTNGLDFIKV
jgi:hypothetical protein